MAVQGAAWPPGPMRQGLLLLPLRLHDLGYSFVVGIFVVEHPAQGQQAHVTEQFDYRSGLLDPFEIGLQ